MDDNYFLELCIVPLFYTVEPPNSGYANQQTCIE